MSAYSDCFERFLSPKILKIKMTVVMQQNWTRILKLVRKQLTQYVDWLLSTVNPNPPDEDVWIRPAVHPCQRCHSDIQEHDKQSAYVDLLNMNQHHTRCSRSYCLRKKSNETELKCRFHVPFYLCPKTRLESEEIHTSGENKQYRAKIVTKRNDSRLNNHQQLQGWRANCDIQVVIDHYACVEYLTKYAAKVSQDHRF